VKSVPNFVNSVITGNGCYISPEIISNDHFNQADFYNASGERVIITNNETIRKFSAITGILERRYIPDNLVASDMAFLAAEKALEDSKIDKETLDYIIVAHNFGDVEKGKNRTAILPSLASKVKSSLRITNPDTVAYDVIFGCPGWLQGMIQADYFIRSGDAKKILVIGTETMSRIYDPHDKDSMIYADGAGAVVVEAMENGEKTGIISHCSRTYADEDLSILRMGKSNNYVYNGDDLFLKMQGRTVYELALKMVPEVITESIKKAGISINDVKKVLIHQANKKMVNAILKRLYAGYNITDIPPDIMPLTMSWLGNSSVATLPTLYDLIEKEEFKGHNFKEGDYIIFASVGAGLNINSVVYKFHNSKK
jgi:3-oxoacyl-[acyl-carrier-protein] synthase-3